MINNVTVTLDNAEDKNRIEKKRLEQKMIVDLKTKKAIFNYERRSLYDKYKNN